LRTYEALYIIRPDLEDTEVEGAAKTVESLVTSNDGTIVESEIWGKRRLAYKVKRFTEGHYVLLRFQATPSLVTRLKNHFRLADAVIRYLVVRFDEKTLRLEAEQKRRKEAELQKVRAMVLRTSGDRDEAVVSRGDSEENVPTTPKADSEDKEHVAEAQVEAADQAD